MKKSYVKPLIICNDEERAFYPLAAAAGMAAGYAAGRALTNGMKARPIKILNSLHVEK